MPKHSGKKNKRSDKKADETSKGIERCYTEEKEKVEGSLLCHIIKVVIPKE